MFDNKRSSVTSDLASAVKTGSAFFLIVKGLNDASDAVQSLFNFICRPIWNWMKKRKSAPVPQTSAIERTNTVEEAIKRLPAGEQMEIARMVEQYKQ